MKSVNEKLKSSKIFKYLCVCIIIAMPIITLINCWLYCHNIQRGLSVITQLNEANLLEGKKILDFWVQNYINVFEILLIIAVIQFLGVLVIITRYLFSEVKEVTTISLGSILIIAFILFSLGYIYELLFQIKDWKYMISSSNHMNNVTALRNIVQWDINSYLEVFKLYIPLALFMWLFVIYLIWVVCENRS